MRAAAEADGVLAEGLAAIRRQFDVPDMFPEGVEAAAREATLRAPGAEHVDRTDLPFVTLDPASSTDLDQAFCLERSGDDLVLRYAIADVGWFVEPADPLDVEAWRRGATVYLPDGRAPLYPATLSEGAASLLPGLPRPALVFVVRLDQHGVPRLDGVERSIVRSRAKLAYDSVRPTDLPAAMPEFSRRMRVAEVARGAARVEAPEQEVEPDGQGGIQLVFRPRLPSEDLNSSLSLATNLAVAAQLHAAGTGLFRVMDEPDEHDIRRLRHESRALGVPWPDDVPLTTFALTLDPRDPAQAAVALAIRRAGGAARYEPSRPGVVPWHAAMAATYVHATAPLRRLPDRYVGAASLAVANGVSVPEPVADAFARLPEVMERADAVGGQVERAVIDLVESIALSGHEGSTFTAVVTDVDERGARIQLCDIAVVARVASRTVEPGDGIRVKLVAADVAARQVRFERVA
ncbi:MAG: RNB domain-containing ribonuclease [Ilumatobacteraceae bacterium]